MIEFIISILVPILGGLGVSEADVTTYVTNCSGYIYAILISILVLIVLLVAAHFIAPKGKRHLVRWGASLAWVLALVTMVNMVCYGPLYTNLSVVLNGGGTVSDEAKAASNEVIKKVGEEGMVLVKNNGLLPLSSDVDSMNVFGWASTNPIYGGTGSGSADTSSVVSILQSLSDAGYKTNESLTKMYTDYRADRPAATILGGDGSFDITLPEPTADYYTDDVMGEAESFSDVAMVVISRGGGEGYDLPTDMNSVIHGTYNVADEVSVNPANYAYTNISYTNNGDYDDFDAGESYLELSNTEEAMFDKVCSEFSKVIVVINANNPMELDWVDNYDSIGAVILAPGTGQTGMAALGEIINGSVNPSGKTVAAVLLAPPAETCTLLSAFLLSSLFSLFKNRSSIQNSRHPASAEKLHIQPEVRHHPRPSHNRLLCFPELKYPSEYMRLLPHPVNRTPKDKSHPQYWSAPLRKTQQLCRRLTEILFFPYLILPYPFLSSGYSQSAFAT